MTIKKIINGLKNNHDDLIVTILDVESKMEKIESQGDDISEVYNQFINDIDLTDEQIEILGLMDGLLSDKEMFDNISVLKTLVRGTNTITITGHGDEFNLTVNDQYITGGTKESILRSVERVLNDGYLVEMV
jgi:hypothetical protein